MNRAERRVVDPELAKLGRSLLRVRKSGGWAAEGFPSFEAYAHAGVATWLRRSLAGYDVRVDPGQVDEITAEALALAAERRRKRGGR